MCPISSRIRDYPTRVVPPDGLPVTGEILVDHIRGIESRARPLRSCGAAVPAHIAALVRSRSGSLITI
jgi:mRNA interferase MazF